MTKWTDVQNNTNYIKVLDHGFVGLVDKMGDDDSVAEAARISYATGTKKVNNNNGLIRYLVKHKHTSPLEMAELKFHIKLPIFVMRQLVRHRTSSLNETSFRYSVIDDDFYVPELEQIAAQSVVNNQGRGNTVDTNNARTVQKVIRELNETSFNAYKQLLGPEEGNEDMFDYDVNGFDGNYTGIARELARTVIPVSIYTEVVWKQDLHNLFHLLKLRMDSHAQYEIRVFANAMYDLIKDHFPICIEAFEDYIANAKTVSATDKNLLDVVISHSNTNGKSFKVSFEEIFDGYETQKDFLDYFRLSKREFDEFKALWKL